VTLAGRTLSELSHALARSETTSRALTEEALASIAANGTAFTRVAAERARAEADHADRLRKLGVAQGELAGIPISVKDLFAVAGEATPAGAAVLRDAALERADAPVVARLRAAGAIVVGRTHMSEFAFTGLGLNPHAPPCTNPADPARVPGGSSSGAAVSVVRGQAAMGLGTDTGGSVRIPAAFCGLVGFKPTQKRVTRRGTFPLSESLDSIGPIANSVGCCETVDRILAGDPIGQHAGVPIAGPRFALPTDFVLDDMDATVARAFDRALGALAKAGAKIDRIRIPAFAEIPALFAKGTIANAEAYAFHVRHAFFGNRDGYDPNVLARIDMGGRMSAADLIDLQKARAQMIGDVAEITAYYDALVLPTTPQVAPRIEEVADKTAFGRANGLALRNPSLFNFLDRCAISLPMHEVGELPTGLMLVGEHMGDAKLFAVAGEVEASLSVMRRPR
jgi:aspartyl-tRNA(Asn)/glutamyl-tRNA(Gln) amidotransferase subunit A